MFIFSFCIDPDDTLIMLATNTKEFFHEKITEEEIMDRVNESDSSIRLTIKKVLKLLKRKPDKFNISLRNENNLHFQFEYEIKSHQKSLDPVKLNFNMSKITSIEQIGQYFVRGLLKTLIEQNVKDDEERPYYNNSVSCLSIDNSFFSESNFQDLYKMIGIEIKEQQNSPDNKIIKEERESSATNERSSKISKSSRSLKRAVTEKEFVYDNSNISQEFKLEEESNQSTSSFSNKNVSSKNKINDNVKVPRKRPNVKF
ncbi:hypothetical protein PVAND_013619 [Polypedilum vanderplanki]|uniref:Uncharacterized protein n=1 Tax=Polypedilum vanderplanki TaxID=319348 RepID=A0A9J6CR18_POLVA|nr:hypothetical protein PVAND_013619 [Polypedilum vanderplanki]